MRWVVIISILVFMLALYRWSVKNSRKEPEQGQLATEMVQDPNCLTYVPETEAVRATIAGGEHCFCSQRCADEYRKKHSPV